MSNAYVWAAFEVLHSASLDSSKAGKTGFVKFEPSLVTDSFGAFEDGREASDDSPDVGLLCSRGDDVQRPQICRAPGIHIAAGCPVAHNRCERLA